MKQRKQRIAKVFGFHKSRDFGKLRGCNFPKSRETRCQMKPTDLIPTALAESQARDAGADGLAAVLGLANVSLYRSVATAQRIDTGEWVKGNFGPAQFPATQVLTFAARILVLIKARDSGKLRSCSFPESRETRSSMNPPGVVQAMSS